MQHLPWYVSAMERLVDVVQELSQVHDVDAVTAIVRDAARNLTGADGATFVLRDGDQCYYAEENAIAPLWKGKRFPMSVCVSGWVMEHGKSTVIEDIYKDPRVLTEAYRPTFVKSLAMVPIRREAPIGAIGNYWATQRLPTVEEVAILQALADTTSVALQNAELYGKLQQQVHTLQEQQVRIQEQHESLEVFTRALSHDLKEPVRAMISFSHMLQEEQPPEEKQKYLTYVSKAADRMGMLIDNVFNFTQLDDGMRVAKGSCAMQEVVDGVKENLAEMIQRSGASVMVGAMPEVQANASHMMQVMQNLIANAISHNEGKTVDVRVNVMEEPNRWLFSVHDNGRGIALGQREKIFQPFKRLTRDETHAGLGLAICRKIVSFYDGTIWCEPSAGGGATFHFALPKATADALYQDRLANVLLVDDREDDLELTKVTLLGRSGMECNVLIARDGEEAHGILKQKTAEQEKIDLMLLDINMPGVDGFELLERMRGDETLQKTAVVMCTGSTHEEDRQRSRSLGAVGYMVKPPSQEKLEPILENVPSLRLYREGKIGKLVRLAG
jgi:two-component system CheB/CheR fusion protein